MITLTYSGFIMFSNAVLLGYFTFRRWQELHAESSVINSLYFNASISTTLALVVYSIPGLLSYWNPHVMSFLVMCATCLVVIGYSYFLRIPLYAMFSYKKYAVWSHLTSLYTTAIIATLIAIPPTPAIFQGVIYWGFAPVHTVLVLILNFIGFAANIYLIQISFTDTFRSSRLKSISLASAFVLTGVGGGALFIFHDYALLKVAYTVLFGGLFVLVSGIFLGYFTTHHPLSSSSENVLQ